MDINNKDLIGKHIKIVIKDTPHPRTKNGRYLGENDKYLFLEINTKIIRFNHNEIKRIEEDDQ